MTKVVRIRQFQVCTYLPTYETFTSELHPRNDDDLELAPAELDGVTTMYSVCAPRARMLGAEAQAQA